jgi:hypothetical protein
MEGVWRGSDVGRTTSWYRVTYKSHFQWFFAHMKIYHQTHSCTLPSCLTPYRPENRH